MILQNAVYVPASGLYGASIDNHPTLAVSVVPAYKPKAKSSDRRTVVVSGGLAAPVIKGLPTDYVDWTLTSSSPFGDILWATLIGDPVVGDWQPVRSVSLGFLESLAENPAVGVVVNMVAAYWLQVRKDPGYDKALRSLADPTAPPSCTGGGITRQLGLLVTPRLVDGPTYCQLSAWAQADAQRLVDEGIAAELSLTAIQLSNCLSYLYHSQSDQRPIELLAKFLSSAALRKRVLKASESELVGLLGC